ncbi:hypothetical protein C4556_01265 [Candidatus Parcubacteria bacterium]|nr:MAG: hypothetical protein C4556_01265 [Candidatus Parcubacteria bacterium]
MQLVRYSGLSVLLGLTLLLASASIAFAQEASAEANAETETNVKIRLLQLLHDTRAELKADARTELGGLKNEATGIRTDARIELKNASSGAERRDVARQAGVELRANIKERLQVLFRTHLGSIMARLNAAIQHFDNIGARIESRIEKLNANGVDTTSVEASLETAVEANAEAEADVEALSTLASSVTETSNADRVKAEIRAAIQEATASIKAAHRAFLDTAKQLNALVRASLEINSEARVDTGN